MIGLAFAGFVGFGSTLTAYAACTNPSPMPTGYAFPCPVFSVSPASVSQSGTETLSASPQPGTDYIYTTAYYSAGLGWNPLTLQGNNAAPSYSSGPATGSIDPSILSQLTPATRYVVLWDWLWDATAQCYKGPGLNQCNTGTWRLQTFTLTAGTAYTYSQSTYAGYTYSQSAYTSGCTTCNNYYVATTGSDSNSGTQTSPWKTIQHAVDSFTLGSGGTVIHVAAGTYTDLHSCPSGIGPANACVTRGGSSPTVRLVIQCDAAWSIPSGSGCLLRGGSSQAAFSIAANNIDIKGFDYGNISAAQLAVAGMCGSSVNGPCPTANSLHILGNFFHDFGQTGVNGPYGAGCQWVGAISFQNHHGSYVTDARVIIVRSGTNGLQIAGGDVCTPGIDTVTNNIFDNNGNSGVKIGTGSGANCDASHLILLSNNLASGNSLGAYSGTSSCSTPVNSFSDSPASTFASYPGTSNDDYHLKSGSAAINGGTTACVSGGVSPCTPTTDFSGTSRPQGSAIDIGAYEQ